MKFDSSHWLIIMVAVYILVNSSNRWTEYDDTDDKANKERSGFKIMTDYGTGCQYLNTGMFLSSVTPRLSYGGHHVGCKQG